MIGLHAKKVNSPRMGKLLDGNYLTDISAVIRLDECSSLDCPYANARIYRREGSLFRYQVMRSFPAIFRAVSIGLFLTTTAVAANAFDSVSARSDDFADDTREAAQTWALHRIAVIQAANGDIQGAKRTATQIGRRWDPGPAQVTGVWFRCGQPIFACTPIKQSPIKWQRLDYKRPATTGVPTKVPAGLPADYLDADLRHGAMIDFTDERDSHGTRVTTRVYADGHVAIETPRRGSAAGR